MAAITVKREGIGDIITFDSVAEVGSAAEFISFINQAWGEGALLKPSSTSAFTARTPEPFPHGIYTFLPKSGDQAQLQQDVANLKIDSKNLKIDSKRREIQLTKMLSSASQKTQSERELGKIYYSREPVQDFVVLPRVEGASLLKGCNEVLSNWKQAGHLSFKARRQGMDSSPSSAEAMDVTLSNVVPANPEEAKHMQPRVIELLHAIAHAVQSPQVLVDMHICNYLQRPIAKIDCSGMASELSQWTQLVTPWEFKLSIKEIEALLGQLIDRCEVMFSNQPSRKQAFAVGITLEAVEVFGISRNPEDGKISVQRSGPQSLSISHHSPGLQWISRILQASLTDLGFVSTLPVDPVQIGGCSVRLQKLIALGLAPASQGSGSYVLEGILGDEEPIIVKLNRSQQEENMLTALSGVSNIVQSCASGRVQIFQTEWHAIIIKPYGRLLDHGDSPKLYAQATYDVAVALQLCADRCIAHRDVTSNNIIVYNDRGVLCDFSAAKMVESFDDMPSPTGRVDAITGTPMFAAASTLAGGAHTISSMCEGLFLSILFSSSGGNLPDAEGFNKGLSLRLLANLRRGTFSRSTPKDVWGVTKDMAPLILKLYSLFWPSGNDLSMVMYRKDVTTQEVMDACLNFAQTADVELVTTPRKY